MASYLGGQIKHLERRIQFDDVNHISQSTLADPACVLCVHSAGGCWWWIPVAGPMVGGLVGAAIYFLFIELHHPEPEKQEENNVKDKYEMITMS